MKRLFAALGSVIDIIVLLCIGALGLFLWTVADAHGQSTSTLTVTQDVTSNVINATAERDGVLIEVDGLRAPITLRLVPSGLDISEPTPEPSFTMPDGPWVYVSSSEGDDVNDGRSPDAPLKTLKRARDVFTGFTHQFGIPIEDGHTFNERPGAILLRRGDTFRGQDFGGWTFSGEAQDNPVVIGAYGDDDAPRPVVIPNWEGMTIFRGAVRHVVVSDIHFKGVNHGGAGLSALTYVDDLLLYRCRFEGFGTGINLLKFSIDPIRNVRIVECQVVNNWTAGGKGQGLYADGVDGLTVEGSVFVGNGNWPGVSYDVAKFSQNVYVTFKTRGFVFKGNYSANAASHGLQARSGGVIEGNWFVGNGANLLVGGGDQANPKGVEATIRDNVLFDAAAIGGNRLQWGLELSNIRTAVVKRNLIGPSRWGGGYALQLNGLTSRGTAQYLGCFDVTVTNTWGVGCGHALSIAPGSGQYGGVVVDSSNRFQPSNGYGFDFRYAPDGNRVVVDEAALMIAGSVDLPAEVVAILDDMADADAFAAPDWQGKILQTTAALRVLPGS